MIEYLQTENQVLKEKLGKKRILLNDDQCRRLAVKGKILGHPAREVRVLPTGRGGGATELVRHDPRPHCVAGDSPAAGHVTRE